MHKEKAQHLPAVSLQRIKYVGPAYAQNFQENENIATTEALVARVAGMRGRAVRTNVRNLIRTQVTKANGTVDKRAYNSVLMYLYQHGTPANKLPRCVRIDDV